MSEDVAKWFSPVSCLEADVEMPNFHVQRLAGVGCIRPPGVEDITNTLVGKGFVALDERGRADDVSVRDDGELRDRCSTKRPTPFTRTLGPSSRASEAT